jgi:hypothetical protein
MAAAVNRVLVVCQRKTGHVDKTDLVEDVIIPQIETFVERFVSNASIEYLSPMFEKEGTVDYQFSLGNDTDTSREFTNQNKGAYKVILLQTCTLAIMDQAVPFLYELLDDDGFLFITAFNKGGNDKKPLRLIDNMYGFIDNMNTYFTESKEIEPFMYKKKHLAKPTQLGRKKRHSKRKRTRTKKSRKYKHNT